MRSPNATGSAFGAIFRKSESAVTGIAPTAAVFTTGNLAPGSMSIAYQSRYWERGDFCSKTNICGSESFCPEEVITIALRGQRLVDAGNAKETTLVAIGGSGATFLDAFWRM